MALYSFFVHRYLRSSLLALQQTERKGRTMTTATRARVLLRACPRCSGDLFLDVDDYSCLQCGKNVSAERLMMSARIDSVLEMAMARGREPMLRLVAPHLEVQHDAA